jgi:hypothetical protein
MSGVCGDVECHARTACTGVPARAGVTAAKVAVADNATRKRKTMMPGNTASWGMSKKGCAKEQIARALVLLELLEVEFRL